MVVTEMAADRSERTEFDPEIEDLAYDFIKEEVGRFDWRRNWQAMRKAGTAEKRLTDWLRSINVSHAPEDIVSFLDRMVSHRGGLWV